MNERFEIGPMEKDSDISHNIQAVNQRLASLGIRLALEPSGDGGYLLTLQVKKNARNAGKRRISFLDSGISCTPEQIREMIREDGADNTARYLGCSRATLFRRLREGNFE